MVIKLTHDEAERACGLVDMCAASNPECKFNMELATGGRVCIFKSSMAEYLCVRYWEEPDAPNLDAKYFGLPKDIKAMIRDSVPSAPRVYDSIW